MLYWSTFVPGNKWQYGGVISMFFICHRINAESMTKQWHTSYGYAVHPEKVRTLVFLFDDLLLPFDTSGPLMGLNLIHSMHISPTFFSSSSTSTTILGDLRWRLGRNVRGGERWLCALPVSLSICSYLLHCYSQLSEFIYASEYEDRSNSLPT